MKTACHIVLATILLGGCSFELPAENEPEMEGDLLGANEVLVRFRNFASVEAVNAEFYVAAGPLAEIPDDLFVPENLVMADLGVAGTGILEPFDTDTLLLPCTPDLVIGTTGGTFSDNGSGEVRGVGDPRWVQAAAVGFCGREVIFDYAVEGDEFLTLLTVVP